MSHRKEPFSSPHTTDPKKKKTATLTWNPRQEETRSFIPNSHPDKKPKFKKRKLNSPEKSTLLFKSSENKPKSAPGERTRTNSPMSILPITKDDIDSPITTSSTETTTTFLSASKKGLNREQGKLIWPEKSTHAVKSSENKPKSAPGKNRENSSVSIPFIKGNDTAPLITIKNTETTTTLLSTPEKGLDREQGKSIWPEKSTKTLKSYEDKPKSAPGKNRENSSVSIPFIKGNDTAPLIIINNTETTTTFLSASKKGLDREQGKSIWSEKSTHAVKSYEDKPKSAPGKNRKNSSMSIPFIKGNDTASLITINNTETTTTLLSTPEKGFDETHNSTEQKETKPELNLPVPPTVISPSIITPTPPVQGKPKLLPTTTLSNMQRPQEIKNKRRLLKRYSLYLALFMSILTAVSGSVAFAPYLIPLFGVTLVIAILSVGVTTNFINEAIVYIKTTRKSMETLKLRGIPTDVKNFYINQAFFSDDASAFLKNQRANIKGLLEQELKGLNLERVKSEKNEKDLKTLFQRKLDYYWWAKAQNPPIPTELDSFIAAVLKQYETQIGYKTKTSQFMNFIRLFYWFVYACFTTTKFFELGLFILSFLGMSNPPVFVLILLAVAIASICIFGGYVFSCLIFSSLHKANLNDFYLKKIAEKMGLRGKYWPLALLLLIPLAVVAVLAILTSLADVGAYTKSVIQLITQPITFFVGHSISLFDTIVTYAADIAVMSLILPATVLFTVRHSINATIKLATGILWLLRALGFTLLHPQITWRLVKETMQKLDGASARQISIMIIAGLIAAICLPLSLIPDMGPAADGADSEDTAVGHIFEGISIFLDKLLSVDIHPAYLSLIVGSFVEALTDGDFVIADGRESVQNFLVSTWNHITAGISAIGSFVHRLVTCQWIPSTDKKEKTMETDMEMQIFRFSPISEPEKPGSNSEESISKETTTIIAETVGDEDELDPELML